MLKQKRTRVCEEGALERQDSSMPAPKTRVVMVDVRDASLARDLLTLSSSKTINSSAPSQRESKVDSRLFLPSAESSSRRYPGLLDRSQKFSSDKSVGPASLSHNSREVGRTSHNSEVSVMTPTPPTTNSSTGASPDNGQFRVVRKRNRIPLSCAPCRHRKLKCNRGHPCDNCTKRGDTTSCVYASPSARKKPGIHHVPTGTPDDMQNRIDRLESLVLSLMTNGSQAAGPSAAHAAINSSRSNSLGTSISMPLDPHRDSIREVEGEDSDINDVAQDIGIMKIDGAKAFFVPDAHWFAILSDIAEVKNYFASHKEQYQEQFRKVQASKQDDVSGSFLFKGPRLNNKTEVLVTLPDKNAVDDLVKRYFQSYDPAVRT